MQSQLTRFPVIKPFVRAINKDIKKHGVQKGMLQTVLRSGTKLDVHGLTPEAERVLRHEAVVIVANHPHEVDIIALFASLPEREKTSLVISSRFMNLVKSADRYLIPVYIEHHANVKAESLQKRFLRKFHPVPTYTPDEEHQKNIEAISSASKRVSNGEAVIIFPNPTRDETHEWYPGVGYILHGVKRKKPVYVMRTYIEGTSNFDYLRLLPHAARVLTPIKVTFAKPIEMSSLLKEQPKIITAKLEASYRKWVKGLLD